VEHNAIPGAPPTRDRFGAWLARIQQEFHVTSEVIAAPPRFSGAVKKHEIGRMTLIGVTGTAYAGSHARRGGPNTVNVLMAMRGSTHVVQDRFDVVLHPGEYCILDAAASSVATMPAPFHNVIALFPMADVDTVLPSWRQSIGKVIQGRSGAGAVFFDAVRSIVRQGETLESDSRASIADAALDLFGSTLLALPDNRQPAPPHMENFHRMRIKAFVREHLRDPDLGVDMLAGRLNLSPRHIHRLFKSEPQHLMRWVWSERLRHCYGDLSRLSQRYRTVAQIAFAWGFNDSAHFSRAFRRRYGLAPSEVRQRALAR